MGRVFKSFIFNYILFNIILIENFVLENLNSSYSSGAFFSICRSFKVSCCSCAKCKDSCKRNHIQCGTHECVQMEFLRLIMLDFYIVIGITLTFDFCLITVQPLFKKKYILCNSCVIEKEHSNSDINDLFKLLILKQTQCSRLKFSVLFVMK